MYRTLELLTEIGLLTPLQLDGDADRVPPRPTTSTATSCAAVCGDIVEMPAADPRELLARSLEDETGFAIDTERCRDLRACDRCTALPDREGPRDVHELALCQAIVDTVTRHADGHRVERVDVRIGHFRQVVPDSLQFSWELLTDGTELAGCTLVDRPRARGRRVPRVRRATTPRRCRS